MIISQTKMVYGCLPGRIINCLISSREMPTTALRATARSRRALCRTLPALICAPNLKNDQLSISCRYIEWERPPRFFPQIPLWERSMEFEKPWSYYFVHFFNSNTHYKPLTTKRSFDIEPLREQFFRTPHEFTRFQSSGCCESLCPRCQNLKN